MVFCIDSCVPVHEDTTKRLATLSMVEILVFVNVTVIVHFHDSCSCFSHYLPRTFQKIDETAALLARREFHFAKRASLVVHLRRGDKIYNILTARNRRPRRVFTLHPSGRNSTKKRWNSLSTWFVKGPCTSIAQG